MKIKPNNILVPYLLIFFLFTVLIPAFSKDNNLEIIHGPYLQNLTSGEVTIIWFTNKKCVSSIEYSTGENFSTFPQWGGLLQTVQTSRHGLIEANTDRHKIQLQELTSGKKYRYRVVSKEILQFEPYEVIYGNTVVSDIYDFTTLDPAKDQFSFQVVQDIHDDSKRLDSLLQSISWDQMDMVFFNGDTLSHLNDENDIFSGFLDVSVNCFASRIPFFFIRGNHETRGPFARNLIDYFPPRDSRYYYTFKHGPVFFIILDSGEDKPDESPVYAGLADFDQYREEQARWLQEVILREDFKNAAFRIAVFHIPPFSKAYSSQEITRLWIPWFNKGKLDLAICGHLHKRVRQDPLSGKNDFTYIVGSREDCFRIDVKPDLLKISILNMKGETIDNFLLPTKKEKVPETPK